MDEQRKLHCDLLKKLKDMLVAEDIRTLKHGMKCLGYGDGELERMGTDFLDISSALEIKGDLAVNRYNTLKRLLQTIHPQAIAVIQTAEEQYNRNNGSHSAPAIIPTGHTQMMHGNMTDTNGAEALPNRRTTKMMKRWGIPIVIALISVVVAISILLTNKFTEHHQKALWELSEPLKEAVESGSVEKVRAIFDGLSMQDRRILIDMADRSLGGLLEKATEAGHPRIVQCLLENYNTTEEDQREKARRTKAFITAVNLTSISHSAYECDYDNENDDNQDDWTIYGFGIIGFNKFYFTNICDLLKKHEGHWQPYYWIVRYLLELSDVNRPDINAEITEDGLGLRPLILASLYDNRLVVQDLIHHKVDVNAVTGNVDGVGVSSLYVACSYNYTETLDVLLQSGADANTADPSHQTCLLKACENGDIDMVRRLISNAEVDVNSVDKFGETCLHKALINVQYSAHLNDLVKSFFRLPAADRIKEVIGGDYSWFTRHDDKEVIDFSLYTDLVDTALDYVQKMWSAARIHMPQIFSLCDTPAYLPRPIILRVFEFERLLCQLKKVIENEMALAGIEYALKEWQKIKRKFGTDGNNLIQIERVLFAARNLLSVVQTDGYQDHSEISILWDEIVFGTFEMWDITKGLLLDSSVTWGYARMVWSAMLQRSPELQVLIAMPQDNPELQDSLKTWKDYMKDIEREPQLLNYELSEVQDHHLSKYYSVAMHVIKKRQDANVNIPDKQGATCLDIACCGMDVKNQDTFLISGRENLVKLLIKHQSTTTDHHNTCLRCACAQGLYSVVELLLKRGVNVSATDERGRTWLSYACGLTSHSEDIQDGIIEKMLKRSNSHEYISRDEKVECFQHAKKHKHLKTVKLLKELKLIDSDDINSYGRSDD